MKSPSRSLSALLIATSALIAPHALAQESVAEATQETTADAAADEEVADTIVVLGEFIPEPLQETSEVAAFLTSEDLERQGDSNAADALTRVTGLSIAEGRFIYVRGLGERYSSAVLNGSPLPSPEPLQRVVPLDLFPSSVLSNVLVQKSYSVEYPAEFGGGVIDLSTLAMPEQPFFEVGAGFGGDSVTSLSTGYTHDGSDGDVFGLDDGTRKIPNRMQDAFLAARRVSAANFSSTQLQAMGQELVNAPLRLVQQNDSIPLNGNADLAAGHVVDVGAARLGFIGVLGYSNDWKTEDGIQQGGRVETSLGQIAVKDDFNYTSTDNNVGWDGMFATGLEFGGHEIKFTNLYVRRTTKKTYRRFGFEESNNTTSLTERTAWYERELFSTQLVGNFDFGALDVSARAGYAQSSREAPYEWEVRYAFGDVVDTTSGNVIARDRFFYDGSSKVSNKTEFSDLTDEVSSVAVDVTYAIPMAGVRDAVISAGVSHQDNARKSTLRTFRFLLPNGSLPLDTQQSRVDYLFSDFNISPDRFVISEVTNVNGAYNAQLEADAFYVKADLEPIQYVRTSFGIRGERALERLDLRSLFANEAAPNDPPKLKEGYYLPAATVTWNFAEDMQLRLGGSQTIGRPQFRELAPQSYLDPDSDRIFFGNPNLRDTRFTNVDARYEYFFADKQYFTVGAFFKDISRPVESIVVQQGNTVQQSYINAPSAQVFGAEIEVKKLFDSPFTEGMLAGTTFLTQANYTFSDSEIQVSAGDTITTPSGSVVDAVAYLNGGGQRLQGQSQHVANVQLGWENDASQGTLLVTYVSERSSARGPEGQPDIIQEPGTIIDFVYSRDFEVAARPFTFKFKAGNLLGEEFIESQSLGGGTVINNQYDLGRTFSLGLSTAF